VLTFFAALVFGTGLGLWWWRRRCRDERWERRRVGAIIRYHARRRRAAEPNQVTYRPPRTGLTQWVTGRG
jgi:hypothetical protein